MVTLTQSVALAFAALAGYLYAATRNWVWYPKWLRKFVFDEKPRKGS